LRQVNLVLGPLGSHPVNLAWPSVFGCTEYWLWPLAMSSAMEDACLLLQRCMHSSIRSWHCASSL